MEQPLTAKALAHLPPYMPLQNFFLDQYHSHPSNQQGNNSQNGSYSSTNSCNSNRNHVNQYTHNNHNQQQHKSTSNHLSSGYSISVSNSSLSSSSVHQQPQISSFSFQSQHNHLTSSQSYQLQQQLPNLQLHHQSSSSQNQHQTLMMEMLSTSDTSEEGAQNYSLQQLANSQQLNQMKKMEQKYKTELCKNWVSKGVCQYGSKCRFAHGKDELIERLAMNKNYKTKLCTTYHKERICQYAARCHFKHDERSPSEIRYQHLYQKHIFSHDDKSIVQFQFGLTPRRLPFFKKLQGLDLNEEDIQITQYEQQDYSEVYSQPSTNLSQIMMLVINNDNKNQLSQQQPYSNSPFYLMNYPSTDSTPTVNNNYNSINGYNIQNNFFLPSATNLFSNSISSVKQCSIDKDLSMISNTNTAETSESISNFSLNDKFNSIPSAEKLLSTTLFA